MCAVEKDSGQNQSGQKPLVSLVTSGQESLSMSKSSLAIRAKGEGMMYYYTLG